MDEKKVMLSGIQPSGDLTLGSYLGAIKNWGARAEEFDCYYFMADMHSITVRQDPAALRRQLDRYAACQGVAALVVLTERAVPLPARLHGKPVRGVALNRLWGVALP